MGYQGAGGQPGHYEFNGADGDIANAQFATWPLYKPFFTGTQQLRIAYTDLCGNPQTMPLGTIKWARALSAPGEWLLYTQ